MKKLSLTIIMSILALSISFAQNAKYDLRATLYDIDCDANKAYFELAVKAFDANTHFNIQDTYLRFSFNRAALVPQSGFIEEELDMSGIVVSPDSLYGVYHPHILISTDTIASYGIEFGGQGGYLLTHEKWLPIARLGFDIADIDECAVFEWNTQQVYPPTSIYSRLPNGELYEVAEGNYENAEVCFADYCPPPVACPNDITFTTQQQIDDFASDYPGCTEIPGNLYIAGMNPMSITSLDGLSQITSVGGVLSIFNNDALTNLSGLQNISTIGDVFIVGYNDGLTNLAGLSSLTSIGGQFILTDNIALTGIGINSLTTIDGNLFIDNNDALNNLDMSSLTSIGGNLDIKSNISVSDFSGLSSLTTIGGDLLISSNGITALGLNSLNSINGMLSLQSNYSLTTIESLENLDYTTIQDLAIVSNRDLSICSTETLCNYLENGGTNQIGGNNLGCNSNSEVLAGCNEPLCTPITVTDSQSIISDNDLFIDGTGFANNSSITFTDTITPAGATLSDVSLELYFRLAGTTCESEIAIQITDPTGSTQPLTAYTTCNGNTGLYYISLDVPTNAVTTSSISNWLVEFDDTNDQNSGYEYSVRFGRLNYTSTLTTSGGTPVSYTDEISNIFDKDLFIDGIGFANNPSMTFNDPGTPADATLSNISLELYFRLKGASCENEIAMKITDPAGNTQPLTAYTTCDGGTGLYYINLTIPSGNTSGSIADWTIQFDDTNDQNSGDEYSVRFGRLTYTAKYDVCSEAIVSEDENETTPQFDTTPQQRIGTSIREDVSTSIKLYPVPAIQHLNVDYQSDIAGTVHFEIVANSGSMLMAKEEVLQAGLNVVQFELAELPAGHYYIRAYSAEGVPQVQSFVKVAP